MKHQSTKLTNAAQRWQASGSAQPSPLKDRLAMLDEIMMRADLTQTEHRICYYLIVMRTNAETGLCFATDQNLADALGVTKRAIEKSKQSLKAKGLLDWYTERLNGKNSVSLYKFNYKVRPNTCSVLQTNTNSVLTEFQPNTRSVLQPNARSVSHGTPVPHQIDQKYLAKDGSPEWQAWDQYTRITTGRGLPPSKRYGGWYVASQWPPTTQQRSLSLSEIFDL